MFVTPRDCYSDPDSHQQGEEVSENSRIERVAALFQSVLVENLAQVPKLHPDIAKDLTERGFQLLPSTIGRGSYGAVYKVQDAVGNLHALKVIQQLRDIPYSLTRGPHLAARVQHPNIVAPELIYYQKSTTHAMTFEPEIGDYCTAMLFPYIEGKTVGDQWDVIQAQPKLILWILREVGLAIQVLSTNNIEHNDLASRNIMINLHDNKVSVIDFDLATLIDPQTPHYGNRLELCELAKHLIANCSHNYIFSDFAKSRFKQAHIQHLSQGFDFERLQDIQSKAKELEVFQNFVLFAEQGLANVADLVQDEGSEANAV